MIYRLVIYSVSVVISYYQINECYTILIDVSVYLLYLHIYYKTLKKQQTRK